MDYKNMITPYLDSIRTERTQNNTIRVYSRRLNESIDFLIAGNFEPNEAYYSALEAHLSENYQASTIKGWLSLTRRFFDWTSQASAQLPLILPESREKNNEEAHSINFTEKHEEILKDKAETSLEPENNPSIPHVDTDALQPMPPHEQQEGAGLKTHSMGRPRKSSEARTKKLSIYLTPSLEADLKALARIQELSTPDYIFHLIERETERKADKIAAFRALKED